MTGASDRSSLLHVRFGEFELDEANARLLRRGSPIALSPTPFGLPYADAATLMCANLDRGNTMTRHRVGLALPVGMRGRKREWTAGTGRKMS
jgi:hypothetical protein